MNLGEAILQEFIVLRNYMIFSSNVHGAHCCAWSPVLCMMHQCLVDARYVLCRTTASLALVLLLRFLGFFFFEVESHLVPQP